MTGLRAPRSLRRRLVLGVTALATLAVLAAELIGFVVLRSWLLDGVDQRLADFRPTPASAFLDTRRPGKPEREALPSDFRVYFYDARGNRLPQKLGLDDEPGPQLPDSIDRLLPTEGSPVSVAADTGDGNWRVLRRDGPRDLTVVIALPLDTVDGATSKILWLNGLLLIITVAALWVLGREVVRLSLLPLTRMERTAEAITAGQLDLRLPDTDPQTEIGRLGTVLNTMLDRLQQALHERETSETRLRRFVADAGHELRTPLTAIQGFAQLALRSDRRTTSERQEADRHIAQNAERMSLLVDDLQLLAQLDRHPDYQQEHVDLLSLAADAVSSAALQRPGHPVSLSPLRERPTDTNTDAEEGELDVVEVVGDPHRLRQIVENLLSNAHTHTPPGSRIHVRVGAGRAGARTGGTHAPGRISMAPSFPAGTRVAVIEVEDDGPGLPAADAARVFERFYRVDPARTRARGGSGLGLAIATAIAEGHGGRLELDTGQDRGVTFRLVLPLPPAS
ncbi:sensor histidine kinase [Streptomyces apocyni]|uniref:sensor histidine kinase n=1 Tax=Streptomyces apocyni TaxID=2654677 RepID=UPI0012EA9611|nr:ATP-binding protein [Streptomyces apocyni]